MRIKEKLIYKIKKKKTTIRYGFCLSKSACMDIQKSRRTSVKKNRTVKSCLWKQKKHWIGNYLKKNILKIKKKKINLKKNGMCRILICDNRIRFRKKFPFDSVCVRSFWNDLF